MKKITRLTFVGLSVILMAGCQNTSFKKTKSNLVYKIYHSKDTAAVHEGDFMKMQVIQKINDSTLFDSHETLPVYLPAGQSRPYDPSELFSTLKLNDSLVTVQMMDTFIKQNPRLLQRFKNGDRIITSFKVLHIYKRGENYMIDQQKDQEKIVAARDKELDDYIAANKIDATKTKDGVYVQIIAQGQGAQADSGKYVSVKYKGSTLKGKVFDTNMDSTFHHTELLKFTVGKREMVTGFDDGVRSFKNGGHGKIYIPTMLAWGPNPTSPDIKPFEPVMFELAVENVEDKAPERSMQNMPLPKIDTTQRKK
jgi:FKBP-type peptidyl-prolyl cis-trans isomerase